MNWKHLCLSCAVATALFITGCDKDDDKEDVNAQDETFMSAASKSNRAEIGLSEIALAKASNSGVKAHAQMMITDHTASQAELASIHSTVDTDVNLNDSLDADQIAMRTMLLSIPAGPSFDSAYTLGQSVGHQKTINAFNAEISGGENAQVKGFASAKLPVIQMHKMMADSLFTVVQ